MKPEKIRPHPLTARRYLTKYSLIFLIPAVQGLLGLYQSGNLSNTARTALLVSVVWVLLAALRYRRFSFLLHERYAEITQGLFFHRTSRVRYADISCMLLKRTPVAALCGGVELRLETEAGSRRKADFECVLRARDAKKLAERIYGPAPPPGTALRFPARRLLILAAMTSSAATGLLTAAPLVDKAGDFLGEGISQKLYGTIDYAALFFAGVLPAAAGWLAAVLLIGYGIAFLFTLFRYGKFRLAAGPDCIFASGGLISGFTAIFRKSDVGAVIAEQGSLLRLISNASVRVCIAGYGKNRGESALLIPATRVRNLSGDIGGVIPGFSLREPDIRPPARSLKRFILLPAALLAAAAGATVLAALLSGSFARFYVLLGLFAVLFLLCLFSAEYICFRKGGVGFGGTLRAVSRRGFKIVRMEIAKGRAGYIRVRESPFDRKAGQCSIKVAVFSERAASLSVRCLNKEEVRSALLSETGADIDG